MHPASRSGSIPRPRSKDKKMNGSGEQRYGSGFEKISKKLKLMYPCACCGENSYQLKEVHHIDADKKNSEISNLVVLCIKCHSKVHKKEIHLSSFLSYKDVSFHINYNYIPSEEDKWIMSNSIIKIIPSIPVKIGYQFRKNNIKGFISLGSKGQGGVGYYIGMVIDDKLIGVLGFSNPEYGDFSVFLKGDTTPSFYKNSTDLLLYILRTKEVKKALEDHFNREISTAYSLVFTQHEQINRYRKHGKLVKKLKIKGGYNLGYLFELGTISSIKEAKSLWFQKNKI
jgi:hypothetical protein